MPSTSPTSPEAGAHALGLADVLDAFEDPAALLGCDGGVLATNRAWRVHGFAEPAFADGDRGPVNQVLRGDAGQRAAVGRVARRDGWHWYRSRVRAVTSMPGVVAVLTHRDITDERRLQLRMAQSPVAHLELAPDGSLLGVNERWEEIRGRPVGAELGMRWLRDTPAEERRALVERLGRPEAFTTTLTTVGADERPCSVELELEPALDGVEWIGWRASATDVTDVRALAAVADNAFTDDLTGVANRGLFTTTVARVLGRRSDEPAAAVLFLDLDEFKPVNDLHGHAAGDEVLRLVAERITSVLRPADLVARYGGDEFAVFTEAADEESSRLLGERLVDALRSPFAVDGRQIEIGVSVGVALTRPGDDVDAIVRRADRAMYTAKRDGGSRVVLAPHVPPEAR